MEGIITVGGSSTCKVIILFNAAGLIVHVVCLPLPSSSSSSIFLSRLSSGFSSPMVSLDGSLRDETPLFSESFYNILSQSISNTNCGNELDSCRDSSAAFQLKLVAIASILLAGIFGIAIPLVGKNRRFLRTDSNPFFAAKAFAAGVILATGFVHMLPDSTFALTDKCLPEFPWLKFPVSGFIAMMSALATLLTEFVGTQYYRERKEEVLAERTHLLEEGSVSGKVFGEEEGGGMHIVGMHAHAAHHRHSHAHGQDACGGHAPDHALHSHAVGIDDDDDGEGRARHLVVSQILEMGIVSHSVIIGLSLGVSQSPCTIRPLIAALTFHQFFEGFALGGCISQAQYSTFSATMMACFFAITTPAGIVLGIAVSSFYNRKSPRALIAEGTLDAISAGILVYMALVDLIAADFLSKRMSCNVRLQVVSYFALFAGALMMSSLAIWV